MTKHDFISRLIGVPWVNRASSFDAVDCWGLIYLYYDCVLNIVLPETKGFIDDNDFESCFNDQVKHWEEVSSSEDENLVFTSYKAGRPTHVGLCIGGGKVLHARGNHNNHGKVEIHSIKTIEKIYGKVRLYKFTGKN